MTRSPEPLSCEVCGAPEYAAWGWDFTPLCRAHFDEAERRYASVEESKSDPDPEPDILTYDPELGGEP